MLENIITLENGIKFNCDKFANSTKIVDNQLFEEPITFYDEVKRLNKLPFSNLNIKYSEDKWDFSKAVSAQSKFRGVFYFSDFPEEYKDDAKSYVLSLILNKKNKFETINNKLIYIKRFMIYLINKQCYQFELISPEIISEYFSNWNNSACTKKNHIRILEDFFVWYNLNIKKVFTPEDIESLNSIEISGIEFEREKGKYKPIPNWYFKNFLKACISIMNNKSETKYYRGLACLYLIMSQTGLRISEIYALEIDAMEMVSKTAYGEFLYSLRYKTFKKIRGAEKEYSVGVTYVNKITYQAYNTLVDLYDKERLELKTLLLFVGKKDYSGKNLTVTPVRYTWKNTKNFFIHLNNYFPTIMKNIDKKNDSLQYKIIKEGPHKGNYLIYLHNHQFRTTVVCSLLEKGVSIFYVKKYMAHLTSEMTYSYSHRNDSGLQENIQYSKKIIEGMITGEEVPLGADKKLINNIKNFIKDKNYNVYKDLDEVIKEVAGQLPIRQKSNGLCCIKSSPLRECGNDARTNEYFCLVGLCPNVFTFYYNLDLTYKLINELLQIIQYNKTNGFNREAQREVNKLESILRRRFIPEFKELKRMMVDYGEEYIVEHHPEVLYYINNEYKINEELKRWIEMYQLKIEL